MATGVRCLCGDAHLAEAVVVGLVYWRLQKKKSEESRAVVNDEEKIMGIAVFIGMPTDCSDSTKEGNGFVLVQRNRYR